MKNTINILWKEYPNFQYVLEKYAGMLGIFGIFFGHKVDRKQKAKFDRAKKYLMTLVEIRDGAVI